MELIEEVSYSESSPPGQSGERYHRVSVLSCITQRARLCELALYSFLKGLPMKNCVFKSLENDLVKSYD